MISKETNEETVFKKLECENIVLDSSKLNLITNIMSNINLPSSCTPEWAKTLPEQVWKNSLIENLNAKQTDLFTNLPKGQDE